jgi:hypothetical protein
MVLIACGNTKQLLTPSGKLTHNEVEFCVLLFSEQGRVYFEDLVSRTPEQPQEPVLCGLSLEASGE